MLGRLNVKLTDVDGSTRTVDVGVFLSAPPSLAPGAAKHQVLWHGRMDELAAQVNVTYYSPVSFRGCAMLSILDFCKSIGGNQADRLRIHNIEHVL